MTKIIKKYMIKEFSNFIWGIFLGVNVIILENEIKRIDNAKIQLNLIKECL